MDKPGFKIYKGDIGGSRIYRKDSLHDHWEPEVDYGSVKSFSINSYYRQKGPGSSITDRHFQNAKYQQSVSVIMIHLRLKILVHILNIVYFEMVPFLILK